MATTRNKRREGMKTVGWADPVATEQQPPDAEFTPLSETNRRRGGKKKDMAIPASEPQPPATSFRVQESATVRIDVVTLPNGNSNVDPPLALYVTTDQIENDEHGIPVCRLSDILPRAVMFNSPMKSDRVKLWRVDPVSQNPTPLGRGNILTDSSLNSMTIGQNPYLDLHRLKLEKPAGGSAYHSGVKLLIQHDSDYQARASTPTDCFGLATGTTRPLNIFGGTAVASPLIIPSLASPHIVTSPSANQSFGMAPEASTRRNPLDRDSTDVVKIEVEFLRGYFKINPLQLPGKTPCSLARQALDRYKAVKFARKTLEGWNKIIPSVASQDLAGAKVTLEDLQEAFGFKDTTWSELHKRWDPDTQGGLAGASTITAWADDPDGKKTSNSPLRKRFEELNLLRFDKLKTMITRDRAGEWGIAKRKAL